MIVAAVISAICIKLFKKATVIFGVHISAAAPRLVTDAEIFQHPRIFAAVFPAKLCHRRCSAESHIFDPFAHFLHSTRAYITVYICITTELLAKFKILMCSERIVFNNTAPIGIYHLFSVFFRTDAVFPMVFVGKTAAGPTQNGNPHFFKCIYGVATHTVFVWYFRIFADIKSLVNTSAEMFAEMAVNILIDCCYFLIWID